MHLPSVCRHDTAWHEAAPDHRIRTSISRRHAASENRAAESVVGARVCSIASSSAASGTGSKRHQARSACVHYSTKQLPHPRTSLAHPRPGHAAGHGQEEPRRAVQTAAWVSAPPAPAHPGTPSPSRGAAAVAHNLIYSAAPPSGERAQELNALVFACAASCGGANLMYGAARHTHAPLGFARANTHAFCNMHARTQRRP